jgi:nicotinamidase-related amidase
MKNLGIVIVDMQNKFRSCMNNFNEIIEAHKNLINFGEENNLPIFYLEYQIEGHHRDPQIMTIYEIRDKLIDYNNAKRTRKYNDNGFIVQKNSDGKFVPYEGLNFSIMGDSHLDIELKNKNIEKIIFTGVNRNCCVKETANEAKKRNYKIYTAKDLMNNPVEKDWFTQNTKYFETHKELINYFSKSFVTKFLNKSFLSPKNSY